VRREGGRNRTLEKHLEEQDQYLGYQNAAEGINLLLGRKHRL
jgi:hypothetical protein